MDQQIGTTRKNSSKVTNLMIYFVAILRFFFFFKAAKLEKINFLKHFEEDVRVC